MILRSQKGVTLLEVLLSIVILTIILASIMNFFPQMGLMNKLNVEKIQGVNLANEVLLDWQNVDFRNFLNHPSKDVIPEYSRYESPNYIFKTEKAGFDVEIELNEKSDLKSDPTKAHVITVKILNDQNNVISETYGYVFYEEE